MRVCAPCVRVCAPCVRVCAPCVRACVLAVRGYAHAPASPRTRTQQARTVAPPARTHAHRHIHAPARPPANICYVGMNVPVLKTTASAESSSAIRSTCQKHGCPHGSTHFYASMHSGTTHALCTPPSCLHAHTSACPRAAANVANVCLAWATHRWKPLVEAVAVEYRHAHAAPQQCRRRWPMYSRQGERSDICLAQP